MRGRERTHNRTQQPSSLASSLSEESVDSATELASIGVAYATWKAQMAKLLMRPLNFMVIDIEDIIGRIR